MSFHRLSTAAKRIGNRILRRSQFHTFDDDPEAIRLRDAWARKFYSWINPVTGITVEDHSLCAVKDGLWVSRDGESIPVALEPDEQVMIGNVAIASAAPIASALTCKPNTSPTVAMGFFRLILIRLPAREEPLGAIKVETVVANDGSSHVNIYKLVAISGDGERLLVRRLDESGSPGTRPAYRTFRFNVVTKEWNAVLP